MSAEVEDQDTNETNDNLSLPSAPQDDFDEQQEVARSSFADMLHDTERNQKYYDALKLAVAKMHSLGKKAKVLDIGTGSGLLSMMAVNCGADSVTACEAFVPVSKIAKSVLQVNNFVDKIKIIPKHSTKLIVGEDGDMLEKANILVAEVFDTELIGEGALRAFSHAQEQLLESDSIVIPSYAIVYAQVVESKTVQNWNKCNDFCDSNEILIKTPEAIRDCTGSAAVHDLQLSQLQTHLFKQISAPQIVFHFDWSGKSPLLFNQCKSLKIVAENNGVAQVVFMWWELAMDPENTITISCAPYWAHPLIHSNPKLTNADIPWRDHWLQAIYYLPTEITVHVGQELNLISCHDEFSMWFYLEPQLSVMNEYKSLICECGLHATHSRTRIGQINDELRRKKYLSYLKKHVNNESVILFLGNGFYLGLAAAKFGAKKLLFIEENHFFAMILKSFAITNNISNCEILESIDTLRFHPNSKDITLILGEPYFDNSILPWDNIQFGYMVKQVKEYVRQDVIIAPNECLIKGMIVEFVDLQKIQFPIEVCGEFDMKPFDDVVQASVHTYDPIIEAQPLWEYPCSAKSLPVTLAKLNMNDICSSSFHTFNDIIRTGGTNKNYNAIVFWTEWNLDGTDENIITTGPISPPEIGKKVEWDMYTRQGVKFVQPKDLGEFYFKFQFDLETGNASAYFC